MLKRIGFVVVAAVGLSALALPAMASANPADQRDLPVLPGISPTVEDAHTILGGGDLGDGAADLVAGAHTGAANTPVLIAHSLACGTDC